MILFIRCRFRGQPGLWRRGSGGEDVVLLRLPGGPDPHRLRALTLSLHGGDPGGAAVRGPVETLPRHWHRNDHHKGRKVNLSWNINKKNHIYGGEVQHIGSDSCSIFQNILLSVRAKGYVYLNLKNICNRVECETKSLEDMINYHGSLYGAPFLSDCTFFGGFKKSFWILNLRFEMQYKSN